MVPPLQCEGNSSPGTCYCSEEIVHLVCPLQTHVQLTGIFEVSSYRDGVFSSTWFLFSLSPNGGGEIGYI